MEPASAESDEPPRLPQEEQPRPSEEDEASSVRGLKWEFRLMKGDIDMWAPLRSHRRKEPAERLLRVSLNYRTG